MAYRLRARNCVLTDLQRLAGARHRRKNDFDGIGRWAHAPKLPSLSGKVARTYAFGTGQVGEVKEIGGGFLGSGSQFDGRWTPTISRRPIQEGYAGLINHRFRTPCRRRDIIQPYQSRYAADNNSRAHSCGRRPQDSGGNGKAQS